MSVASRSVEVPRHEDAVLRRANPKPEMDCANHRAGCSPDRVRSGQVAVLAWRAARLAAARPSSWPFILMDIRRRVSRVRVRSRRSGTIVARPACRLPDTGGENLR